ncbi:MAG: HNH endonuclease [Calditrichaeota bacterium]|nr:HNH endonuclease [Calditrichota bacterium]
MARQHGTKRDGSSFGESTVTAVWDKGTVVAGRDAAEYRKDSCGAIIRRASYGTLGDFGWEIDHDKPVAKNGSDDLSNLQPLHWENNRHKSDDYPNWSCKKKS